MVRFINQVILRRGRVTSPMAWKLHVMKNNCLKAIWNVNRNYHCKHVIDGFERGSDSMNPIGQLSYQKGAVQSGDVGWSDLIWTSWTPAPVRLHISLAAKITD